MFQSVEEKKRAWFQKIMSEDSNKDKQYIEQLTSENYNSVCLNLQFFIFF